MPQRDIAALLRQSVNAVSLPSNIDHLSDGDGGGGDGEEDDEDENDSNLINKTYQQNNLREEEGNTSSNR